LRPKHPHYALLALLGPEWSAKFAFTSAVPNEGKSFTSAIIRLRWHSKGYRVLLIDGDLRRRRAQIFRFPSVRNNSDEDTDLGVIDCLCANDVASAARQIPAGEIQIVDENIASLPEYPHGAGVSFPFSRADESRLKPPLKFLLAHSSGD